MLTGILKEPGKMNRKYFYECTDCRTIYEADKIHYLCPECEKLNRPALPPKGVLRVRYDYTSIMHGISGNDPFWKLQQNNFLPLLPLESLETWPYLKVGGTPLYNPGRLGQWKPDFHLYLKDDSQNPTFSFKDRASALVSAWAKENGIDTIITASTGNAGSSLAGICASQGQRSYIFVPASAPLAKLTQIVMYGATLVPVKGTYDSAFNLSVKASEIFGFYNRNTGYNPLTIEGKKTVSFELYDQLDKQVPDLIFVPTGDGVVLAGVYKGFEDLLKVGIINKMPTIVAVQSKGSDNLVRNLDQREFTSIPSNTLADSISVDFPRNFHMAVKFLKDYQGECITVSDEEILQASALLSRTTGIFSEPAAAAAFAGMVRYSNEKKIRESSKVVVLLTGSGLKDLKSVQSSIHLPEPVEPDIASLKRIFN
jgi:threonine synthase